MTSSESKATRWVRHWPVGAAVLTLTVLAVVAFVCISAVIAARSDREPQRRCTDDQHWLDGCVQRTGVPMRAVRCHEARAVISIGEGEYAVEVELSDGSEQTFRRVGGFGVSPIGNFADWRAESEQRRQAFDALLSCFDSNPRVGDIADIIASERSPDAQHHHPSSKRWLPWLLVGGAVALLLGVFRSRSWRRWWSRTRKRS